MFFKLVIVAFLGVTLDLVQATNGIQNKLFLGEPFKSGKIPVGDNGEMFYVLLPAKSNPKSSPLVIWLTGGGGCSSEFGLFFENGPTLLYTAEDGSVQQKANEFSWNTAANMLYVDQPLGVGYSKHEGGDFLRNFLVDADIIGNNFKDFLKNFLKEYPEFQGSKLFLTGESYAGHYIPSIGQQLLNNPINGLDFQGIAMGNPWVDPLKQYPATADFLYSKGLINEVTYKKAQLGFKLCEKLLLQDTLLLGALECNTVYWKLLEKLGDINPYNVKQKCPQKYKPWCYDVEALPNFLNQESIQKQLGVNQQFKMCNPMVQASLLLNGDWVESTQQKVVALLSAGKKVLVYTGSEDAMCNWIGAQSWANSFQGSYGAFSGLEYQSFTYKGKKVGEIKTQKNFSLMKIYNSGHMVPTDQPEIALEILKSFTSGELQKTQSQPKSQLDDKTDYNMGLSLESFVKPSVQSIEMPLLTPL